MLVPMLLGPNQPPRFYKGGQGISRLRGLPVLADNLPEDFVGSTTEVASGGGVGLTVLSDGRTLREHVAEDPVGYLGDQHVSSYGADPSLLVKLLDTAERLAVHFHPKRGFALRHLNCAHGKSEAWVVVAVSDEHEADDAGHVYLGFRQEAAPELIAKWTRDQDTDMLVGSLNRIPVKVGDTYFVPAGIPHAIGRGLTLVELQEPTDFSVFLEWKGFDLDGLAEGHLGLGFDVALGALDYSGWDGDRLSELALTRPHVGEDHGVTRLFPAAADEFFRAEKLQLTSLCTFSAGFAIVIVTGGQGFLRSGSTEVPLRSGSTVLVPYGAGEYTISGGVEAVRCLPPAP